MKNNDKKRKFKLFDMNRDGKGVDKDEILGPPNLKNFFKSYFRKFTKLLSVNLIMLLQVPCLLLLLFYASNSLFDFHPIFSIVYTVTVSWLGIPVTVNTSEMFAPLYGMFVASGSPVEGGIAAGSVTLQQLLNVHSTTVDMPTFSPLYFIVIGGLLLFTLATWGWQNIGSAYITRNLVRGDPVFVISDYFHTIKKNLKQGLAFGIIDAGLLFVLITNLVFFLTSTVTSPVPNFGNDLMFFLTIGLLILYLCMRKYMYLMLVTFDIKISKLFKNALIFSALGLKRNIMAVLGKIAVLGLNLILIVLLLPYNIIVPVILPLVYYFATSAYISAYAYYPVIEKYMITPYEETQDQD